jgi:hypothetical protein
MGSHAEFLARRGRFALGTTARITVAAKASARS